MSASSMQHRTGHRLIQVGVVLFLLGLLTGFVVPAMKVPRLGLTSHLEGIMNGMLLMILGLVWPRLKMGAGLLRATFWLTIYGTFANWTATGLGGLWGAAGMMPLAGGDSKGTGPQEAIVGFLLISLSIVMVVVSGLLLWGLRGPYEKPE